MANESSNRSPSPMSIRQNHNPNFFNSRNHGEKRGDGRVRRSANGSPFSKAAAVAHPVPWCSNPKTASTTSPAPTDQARRSSFTKESSLLGLLRDSCEQKENKKPNPNSIRGSKNFMSPTISAVSKVTTPSPRKRALAERNEAVRTSASLSDGKFLFFAGAREDDLKGSCEFQDEITHKKEVTHISTCEAKKKVTFDHDVVVLSPEAFSGCDPDELSESLPFITDIMNPAEFVQNEQTDSCFIVSKGAATSAFAVSSPSPIAPLDADPCVPSYDPKTNFLSPRPQFLRYNPDRKAALYLEHNHQPKNLEDSLSSEALSDNDVESNAEEVQSEEVRGEEAESEFVGSSFSSSFSLDEEVKLDEFPNDSTPQPHEEEMCVEEGQEKKMSDDDEKKEMSEDEEEEEEEPCVVSKPRFFTKRRVIAWLTLFGALTFLLSLIVGNTYDSVLSNNHPIYEFGNADISGSIHSMRKWSATYLPLMISSFRETEMVTPSQFLNSSALVCDTNDHYIVHRGSSYPRGEVEEYGVPLHQEAVSHLKIESLEVKLEDIEVQSSPQLEAELQEPDVESLPDIEVAYEKPVMESMDSEESEIEDIACEQSLSGDLASEDPVMEDVAYEVPVTEDVPREHSVSEDVALEQSLSGDLASEDPVMEDVAYEEPVIENVAREQSVSEDVASEQTYFIEQIESENEVVLDDSEEPISYNTVVESGETDSLESFTVEENHQVGGAVAFLVASCCVAIAISALVIFTKYMKSSKNKPVSTGQADVFARKEEASFYRNPSHGSASQLEAENMDAGTYNASAMSSYSIHDVTKAMGSECETQSKEMKQSRRSHKRESLASSSSEYTRGSASYGSFTTYSILPIKNGDEEFVTPVRRSSRIRKKVVSP